MARTVRGTLSPTEVRILQFMADGVTGPEAALIMGVSPTTVKTHRLHMFYKLHVHTAGGAVAEGFRKGLIT